MMDNLRLMMMRHGEPGQLKISQSYSTVLVSSLGPVFVYCF